MTARLLIRRYPIAQTRRPAVLSNPLLTGSSFTLRTMSASTPARKYEWLVVIPDHPGVEKKRVEIRGQHFAGLQPFKESGRWKMGGAILSEMPPDDQDSSLKFAGSALVAVAESKEEILNDLKNDIYAREGVWDVEKVDK